MTNKNYDINGKYNEAEALQQLLRAVNSALDIQNQRFDSAKDCEFCDEQFTITVAGIQTAFVLGGPQVQALIEFVESIASENCYEVSLKEATVTECDWPELPDISL